MRLKDADKLIEAIENYDFGTIKAYGENSQVAEILANVFIFAVKEVVEIIKEQPTAYDVDKVIEVLKNKQDHHKELAEYERQVGTIVEMKEHEYAIRVLSEAIDIVKRGGVSE